MKKRREISIVLKLVLTIGTILFLITGVLNTIVITGVFRTMDTVSRKNMTNITENVVTICNTAYNTSIQNYLRASADSALDIIENYYGLYQNGTISEDEALRRMEEVLLTFSIGESGYIFGIDVSHPDTKVTPIFHPVLSGDTDLTDNIVTKKALDIKNGYFEYAWKNPGEEQLRSKSVYCRYFEPLQIIICASAYTEEFIHLIDKSMFREEILSVRISESDYTTVTDKSGEVIIHPSLEGQNVLNLKDVNGKEFIKEMINNHNKEGWIDYWWEKDKVNEPGKYYHKMGAYRLIPRLNWYVLVTAYEDEIYAEAIKLRNRIIVLMSSFNGIIILTLVLFTMLLLNPLKSLNKMMKTIASGSGDLTSHIEIKSHDEVGTLSTNFNAFIDTLQGLLADVKNKTGAAINLSRTLSDSAEQSNSRIGEITENILGIQGKFDNLDQNIRETSTSTEEISHTIGSLASLIEEQAAAINESSATIEEISGSINNIAKIAQTKEASALELVEITNLGGENVSDTNAVIQSISEEVAGIQEMVKIINGIADQTSLLAMNAAIEAAHAGDSGKGFSVVADEIRKLSETTANNARSISTNIQSVTGKMIQAMELSNKTEEGFKKIHDEVETTSAAFAEISGAMKELDISSNEILNAVGTMNNVTGQVKTGAEEMSTGAGEINETMQNLKDFSSSTLSDLSRISDFINDIKSHFETVSDLSSENKIHLESIAENLQEFKTE